MRTTLELRSKNLWPLLLAAVVAGCGGSDADAPAATPPPAAAEADADGAPASQADIGSDEEPWRTYRLTMPAIRRWYEAQTTIYMAIGQNPDLVDALDTTDQAGDMAELQAHFEGIPEVRRAVADAGLSMRDYTAILLTLTYTQGVDQAVASGADRAQTILSQQVSPENLELVEQNRAELERMQRQLEELGESM